MMKPYLDLFFSFAKVGVMTFGGGYAMLPILQREIVRKKHWATEEELMDYFAIGQCTPGIIAVNTATFVGYKQAGILGGVIATLGLVCPSFIIICLLTGVIEAFSHLEWVQHAMGGVRVCVCILIANAVVKLYRSAIVDRVTLVLFILVTIVGFATSVNPIWLIVLAAGAGLFCKRST